MSTSLREGSETPGEESPNKGPTDHTEQVVKVERDAASQSVDGVLEMKISALPPEVREAVSVLQTSFEYKEEKDRDILRRVIEALQFSPEDFVRMKWAADAIGEVMLYGYIMPDIDCPVELTVVSKHLISLQFRCHVRAADAAIAAGDKERATEAAGMAFAAATVLSKGYDDASFLTEMEGLQKRVDEL